MKNLCIILFILFIIFMYISQTDDTAKLNLTEHLIQKKPEHLIQKKTKYLAQKKTEHLIQKKTGKFADMTNEERRACLLFHKRNKNTDSNDSESDSDGSDSDNDDSNGKLVIKQKVYADILRRTKIALDSLNIPFFLSSGTCLGYLREGKFIDHDYDIDIGIYEEDYTPEIINKMAEQNLLLYRILGRIIDGYELSFRLNGTDIGKAAKVDIFLHYKNKCLDNKRKKNEKNECLNKICWASYIAPKFIEKITYCVPSFSLKKVNFMGSRINVPYPTVKYIRYHYGDTWYIPIKSLGQGGTYDYRNTPKSIINKKNNQ